MGKIKQFVQADQQVITNTGAFQNTISITENDRGGIVMNYAFVKHNRFYSGSQNFSIPWTNKQLQISYETFRDKILPGSQEKWKVKITGIKKKR